MSVNAIEDASGPVASIASLPGQLTIFLSRPDGFAEAEIRNAVHKQVTIWMEQANRRHAQAEAEKAAAAPQPEIPKP